MTTYAYPTTPKFRSVDIAAKDPSIVSITQSGKKIVRKVGGHRWQLTLRYPPLTQEDIAPVRGFISKLRGMYHDITVIPPNLATPQGTQTGDTTVAASYSTGASSIGVTGASSGATFKSGDVLKFNNHNKVYVLVADSTADASGNATLNIVPPLQTAISTSNTVKHSNVPFTMSLSSDLQEISTDVAGLSSYELEVTEVL